MNNFKAYNLNLSTVILRFYLMMAVVIVAGFSGYWLVGLLALPIVLSIMLGVSFNPTKKLKENTNAPVNLKPTSTEGLKNVA